MARKRILSYCLKALISFYVLAPLLPNANSSNETEWRRGKYVSNNDSGDELEVINDQHLTGRAAGLYANSTTKVGYAYALWFVNDGKLNSYTLSVILYDFANYDNGPKMNASIIRTVSSSHVGENATFNFTSDGNLELSDGRGKLAWSSNTQGKGAQYLSMSETGKLILKNQSRVIVWKSSENQITSNHKTNWRAIAGGIVGGLFVIIIIIFVTFIYVLKAKKSAMSSEDDEASLHGSLQAMLPTKFSSRELKMITKDFSQPIGSGAYGEVYRGKLVDGTEVAVKNLLNLQADHKELYTEIAILGRSQHQNLVRLLGYCAKPSRSILVYEFMKNGSLDRWLFGDMPRLTWRQRFDIIVGTAKGLTYLHEECSNKIIHLDVKPQNILLDSELRPKIADFGISKLVGREQSLEMTKMRGTPGYLAPEWLIEGVVTEKADVYGYGVVLFEIFSGKKSRECLNKVFQYHPLQKDGNNPLMELIDSGIADCVDLKEAERVVEIASLCIQDNPAARPSMSKIVQMLEGVVPIPKQCSINVQSRLNFMGNLEVYSSTSSSFTPSGGLSFCSTPSEPSAH